jgi:hypothetical protein
MAKRFLYSKRFCCVAKRFPGQETILLSSNTISESGNDSAVQQNDFLDRKRRCCTAKKLLV